MIQNKYLRAQTAQETLSILSNGYYKNGNGEIINIQNELKHAVSTTLLYVPNDSAELESKREIILRKVSAMETEFEVTNETSLHCCKRLLDDGLTNICCLNFASAKNPGGGFLGGSQAQEESLSRASGLYASIAKQKAYYDTNRAEKSLYYTDNIIYSPKVPVFRDDDDKLLDKPYFVSFITSPAVNVGALVQNDRVEMEKVEEVMINRIDKIFTVALINGHTNLVLGAWGCGVFKNEAKDVARYFAYHLKGNGKYRNKFSKISFAVLDNSSNMRNLSAFNDVFC